ncbi:hypothetical protein, partial [Nonomuraea sp. NPDC002799]
MPETAQQSCRIDVPAGSGHGSGADRRDPGTGGRRPHTMRPWKDAAPTKPGLPAGDTRVSGRRAEGQRNGLLGPM